MKMNSIIIKNCNECELDIPQKYAVKLYDELSIKHPQAFYLMRKVRGWDGKVHFLNKYGVFKIGMLPRVYQMLKEYGLNIKIIDTRRPIPKAKIVKNIGNYSLRKEQLQALENILKYKIADIPFHIGVVNAAVNFGKSLLMSSLYYSYNRQLKTLLITQDADWLRQSQKEFKQYLPDEDITFIQGSKVENWSNFSIGMVQSISRNIKKYQNELAKVDMVLVDEADLAGSKMYQTVLTHLYNTRVRIGLSGTIYMSNLAKDKLKNMNLEAFFGKEMFKFTIKDSIKVGHSTNTIVKLVPCIDLYPKNYKEIKVYQEEYDANVIENKDSYRVILDRLKYNITYDRLPALIVCKYIKHCENLYKYLSNALDLRYKVAYVHVNTPASIRKSIMENFREGRIDILISTTIIARGKNFPKLRYMINAAGMNSQEKSIQFLGRLVRTYEGKNRVYLDDIQYPGRYLGRHSKKRARYYRQEKLKVINLARLYTKYTFKAKA